METTTSNGTTLTLPEGIVVERPAGGTAVPPDAQRFYAARLPPGLISRSDSGDVALPPSEHVVDAFNLVPKEAATTSGPGTVRIERRVPTDRRVVMLTERAGQVRWNWPAAGERPDGKTEFALDLGRSSTAISVALLEMAVGQLEKEVQPGLVSMRPAEVSSWKAGSRIAVQSPEQGPRRVLLFVHGTFSSTAGSFGALEEFTEGREFLADCRTTHDLVLGYDHRTLGECPKSNARALDADLRALGLHKNTQLDIVAFSRGGLVARWLVEKLGFPGVKRMVFVGCTNGGTALAEPDNWKALVNLYTEMAARGGALEMRITGISFQPLAQAAGALAGVAIDQGAIPGLAAMAPDSNLVKALNGDDSDAVVSSPDYYVFGSNFSSGNESEGSSAVRLQILDSRSDELMQEDNDLVVGTASMTKFGVRSLRLREMEIQNPSAIYHTVYFRQPAVVAALRRWLAAPGRMTGA